MYTTTRPVVQALLCAALLLYGSPLRAAEVWWDGNNDTAGFGSASGTWASPTSGTATSGWSSSSTGVAVVDGNSVTTVTADTINLGTDTDGLGSGTITISGTVQASKILFGKASGAITLSGGTIDFGNPTDGGASQIEIKAATSAGSTSATHTFDTDISKTNGGSIKFGTQNTTGEKYVVNGVMSGNFSLDGRMLNNSGVLTLNGANTFTGSASLVTGQYNVNTLADAGSASSLGAGNTIGFAGGGGQQPTLWYTGNTDTSTNRTINLNGGSNRIVSQDAQLTLAGNVTGTNSGFESNLVLAGDAGGGTNVNTVSGVLDGNLRLVVEDFAPIDGTSDATNRWAISAVNTHSGGNVLNNSSTLFVDGSGTLGTGDTTINNTSTLEFRNSVNQTIASNIVINDSGTLTFNNTADVSVTGVISGSGTGGVVKNNTGTAEISMVETYTGPTTVNEGTLRFVNNADLSGVGSSQFNINGGSLEFQSSIGGNNRTVLNNKTFTFGSSGGGNLNFNNGNHLFQSSSAFTHTIETTGGAMNTITATNGGFMNMQFSGNINFNVADGTDDVDLEFSAGFANGLITKNGAGTMSITSSTSGSQNIAINDGILQIAGSGSLNNGSFTANIANDSTFRYNSTTNQTLSGMVSGTGNLVKDNTSTLTLSGDNTYTGTTTVSAGTLVVNGNQSSANGAVTVASGATLAGTGTIGGATTISGTHAPGVDSAGLQTFDSSLTYQASSIVNWQLADNTTASRGTNFDGINVGGNLDFAGDTTLNLDFLTGVDFTNSFWTTDQTWNVWNVTSGVTSNFGNITLNASSGSAAPGTFSVVQNGQNVDLVFTVTAVPEPSSFALLSLGLVVITSRRRRRR